MRRCLWRALGSRRPLTFSQSPTRAFSQYEKDEWTNVPEGVEGLIGRNLYSQRPHPLNLIRQRIVHYMYTSYVNGRGNPLFSVHDNLDPIVTTRENFDSLLVPADHPSRSRNDTFYVNRTHCLRSHTSAHQTGLVQSGLDNFLVVGDVYRKDSIDANHYPIFHQVEAVRLRTKHQVFRDEKKHDGLELFENGQRTKDKQESHTLEVVKMMEFEMRTCLEGLAQALFGKNVELRWVDAYFPFTHPSFELEVKHNGEWLEVLGCGIMEHKLLLSAGALAKVGWAFGLGLDRLAMKLYDIPDIRLLWTQDSGFLSQFDTDDPNSAIKYKPISLFPQCSNDISFWIPDNFSSNNFYQLVRKVGGDIVEQVILVDQFLHPKSQRSSHCYRIIYRHMERTLTQTEVNVVHKQIETLATNDLGVVIR